MLPRRCLVPAFSRLLRHLTVFVAIAPCLLIGTLAAHGGQYRGPTTGPGAPTGPVPLPQPGAPMTPTGIPGAPLTGGSAALDVTSWRVWWELNHDRYVRGRGSEVTDAERRSTIVPVLAKALAATKNPDLNSACLIALGKVAVDHPEIDVLAVLRARLDRGHVEVREAAVLGLGLTGRADAWADLDALVRGGARGRELAGRARVADRVRAFAAYGLGLLAARSTSAAVKDKVLGSLVAVLEDRKVDDRDVLTAALNGIRLLGVDPAAGAAHKRVLWNAVAALERFQARRLKDDRAEAQVHVLTALAGLVGRGDGVDQQRAKRLVAARLKSGHAKDAEYVSAVIALGAMLRPDDTEEVELLVRRVKRPPDLLVPRFGMIALGQIGGDVARRELERQLRKGRRGVQAWAALGLGLLAHHAPAAPPGTGSAQKKVVDVRAEAGRLLHKALSDERDKDLRAAIAIGLGLAGAKAAAPDLRALATKYSSLEDFAGPLCVSLAMLDDRPSIRIALDAMGNIDLPVLFGQAGLALARFDQRQASRIAVAVLQGGNALQPGYQVRLAAAAQAIGYLKNRADVLALAEIVGRGKKVDLPAAFAAAALGAVADLDPVGFGARVAHGMNYAVRALTVSDGKGGILDIF